MKRFLTPLFILAASPAFAAGDKPFFSLKNTDFVVSIAFLIFIGILLYFKVPSKVGEMLDARSKAIKSDLDEARALREEAQSLLASYERKQKEVQEQADRIVASAKEEAQNAATAAKDEIKASVARRLAGAEEQIASAQAAAVKEVKDQAVIVAVSAAKDIMAKQMDAKAAGALIDEAIEAVGTRLH
ncbi:F0F1 ATP synthase subunit B [Yoonia sp. R2331]|uniref:F0F1 ATP synthase subunit B n=1 Tax=Yoonia sp. R2331 TaxID=3237238 RepID=UPI0034E53535